MKVKDLLKMDIDVDVYDNVCEELAIAFCGAQELTEEGEKHFAEVLEYDVELLQSPNGEYEIAIVDVDVPEGKGWAKKLRKAEEFFYSAAGYCADSDYQKWFKEA